MQTATGQKLSGLVGVGGATERQDQCHNVAFSNENGIKFRYRTHPAILANISLDDCQANQIEQDHRRNQIDTRLNNSLPNKSQQFDDVIQSECDQNWGATRRRQDVQRYKNEPRGGGGSLITNFGRPPGWCDARHAPPLLPSGLAPGPWAALSGPHWQDGEPSSGGPAPDWWRRHQLPPVSSVSSERPRAGSWSEPTWRDLGSVTNYSTQMGFGLDERANVRPGAGEQVDFGIPIRRPCSTSISLARAVSAPLCTSGGPRARPSPSSSGAQVSWRAKTDKLAGGALLSRGCAPFR